MTVASCPHVSLTIELSNSKRTSYTIITRPAFQWTSFMHLLLSSAVGHPPVISCSGL
jgi:hypothetical protein